MDDVRKAEREISKGKDTRKEMMMMLGPYINWQEFILPAPMAIAVMGQLMLISSATDFTLENAHPEKEFQYINWPRSFRASLAQVSHAGYDAFNEAQRNMNKIRLYTAKIPSQLQKVVTILRKGTSEDIKCMLPISLQTINEQAKSCLQLAKSVEKKFSLVEELTSELHGACVSSQGDYENKAKDTKTEMALAQISQEEAEKQKDLSQTQLLQLEQAVKKAEERYIKAVDSMPSGMSMVFMKVVDTFLNAFTYRVSHLISIIVVGRPAATKERANEEHASDDHSLDSFCLAITIDQLIDLMVSSLENDWPTIKEISSFLKEQIDISLEEAKNIEKEDSGKEKIISFCERAIVFCEHLNKLGEQPQSEDIAKLKTNMKKLREDSLKFSTKAKGKLKVTPSQTTAPQRADYRPGTVELGGSLLESSIQNAWYKIQTTTAHLEYSKKQYDKACDRMEKKSEKLVKIMKDMAKLDIDHDHFENVKDTLSEGIHALGELKYQWRKICRFFEFITDLIQCGLNVSLKEIVQMPEARANIGLEKYSFRSLQKDLLYQAVFEANKIAYLVNMISGTYVEVSEDYITGPISGLGKLFGLDKEKNESEIDRQMNALFEECQYAQNRIRELIAEKQQEFNEMIDERNEEVQCTLKKTLPDPTAKVTENTKTFTECVEKSLDEMEDDDNFC